MSAQPDEDEGNFTTEEHSPRGMTQGAQTTFLGPVALLSSLATFNPGDNGLV